MKCVRAIGVGALAATLFGVLTEAGPALAQSGGDDAIGSTPTGSSDDARGTMRGSIRAVAGIGYGTAVASVFGVEGDAWLGRAPVGFGGRAVVGGGSRSGPCTRGVIDAHVLLGSRVSQGVALAVGPAAGIAFAGSCGAFMPFSPNEIGLQFGGLAHVLFIPGGQMSFTFGIGIRFDSYLLRDFAFMPTALLGAVF